MKEDNVDEGQGLIQQDNQQTRPLGLRALVGTLTQRASSHPGSPSEAKLLEETQQKQEEGGDDDDFEDDFEDVVLGQHRPRPTNKTAWIQRTLFFYKAGPSIRTLVVAILCFALGVGVGCGLGLGVPYYSTTFTYLLNTIEGLPTLDAHGVPYDLPLVAHDQLVNEAELALRTGFVVSRGAPAVRAYEFNISHALAAPDGFWKPMILANGQSPGPLIEANVGDTVRVRVNNLMPNTSTSIHFHGINQGNSTWMDGVAGVSQCGIPAGGGTWTYEFVVGNQRGTFWWHAHTAVQFTDGLFGPIVIHDPDEQVPETDGDQILFLGENFHSFAAELAASYLSPSSPWSPDEPGVEPLSDNFLLNGQNTFDCAITSTTWPASLSAHHRPQGGSGADAPACTGGQRYSTTVRPGSTLRLRLINHSSYFSYWFSIERHNLTVVEIDGVEVEPVVAGGGGVHVNIGQRYSVVVNATQDVGEYAIRQTLERECFLPFATYNSSGLEGIGYEATGVLRYEGFEGFEGVVIAPVPAPPVDNHPPKIGVRDEEEDDDNNNKEEDEDEKDEGTEYVNPNPWGCKDMPFDQPVPKRAEAAYPLADGDPQHVLDFQFRQAGPVNRIFLNRTSWAPYRDDAVLWQALEQDFGGGNDTAAGGAYNNWGFRLDQQVLLVPDGSTTVQVVLNSLDVMEHPFHMHGHTVQIVGWGPGRYAGPDSSATTWNLEKPMRRDTFTVPQQSHVVFRFRADNPGVWILHCHVAWHLEAGMATSFVERPNDLKSLVNNMDTGTRLLSQSFCSKRVTEQSTD